MLSDIRSRAAHLFKRTVLLVVDMQNGFVWPDKRHVVPQVEALVAEWKEHGGSVVFTKFVNLPGSPYERLIGWNDLRSSPEIDICAELRPYAGCIVEKHFYSAFNSPFADLVRTNGWEIICLCGSDTDSCILKTAVDAFELGYTPYVFPDVCSTHAGDDAHEAALRMIGRFIGEEHVIDSKAFLTLVERVS